MPPPLSSGEMGLSQSCAASELMPLSRDVGSEQRTGDAAATVEAFNVLQFSTGSCFHILGIIVALSVRLQGKNVEHCKICFYV